MALMASPSSTVCARALAARARPRPSYTPSMCWSSTVATCAKKSWVRRRDALVQLLADAELGIRLCEHIEDVDGAVVFRQACVMGLEGIVAKRRDSRYRSGRCREWIKIKNPAHPAIERAMLIAIGKRVVERRG